MQVKAELNYSDLLTVTDMVCSTAFDRDDEFFATAGVFRRVKIFDFASVQDSDTSIHYPVLEIPSRCILYPIISPNIALAVAVFYYCLLQAGLDLQASLSSGPVAHT